MELTSLLYNKLGLNDWEFEMKKLDKARVKIRERKVLLYKRDLTDAPYGDLRENKHTNKHTKLTKLMITIQLSTIFPILKQPN